MNTKFCPILAGTNVIKFGTKIRLGLGMLVNTAPDWTDHGCGMCLLILFMKETIYLCTQNIIQQS